MAGALLTGPSARNFLIISVIQEGTVGLASAGKDTEGVQWFITHCSTPFLTGRYSIFARVVDGMEVVNQVEWGDQIIKVERVQEEASEEEN